MYVKSRQTGPVSSFGNRTRLLMRTLSKQGLLRSTLPGEYLSLFLMMQGSFGALMWTACTLHDPSCAWMVAAGIWVSVRAAGLFEFRRFTPLVSIFLLLAILSSKPDLEVAELALAFFSLPVFVAMLITILVLDIAELTMVLRGKKMNQGL